MKKNLEVSQFLVWVLLIVVLVHVSGPIFAMEAYPANKELPQNFAVRVSKLYKTLLDDWKCLLGRKRKCTWQQRSRIIGELLALAALLYGTYRGGVGIMQKIRVAGASMQSNIGKRQKEERMTRIGLLFFHDNFRDVAQIFKITKFNQEELNKILEYTVLLGSYDAVKMMLDKGASAGYIPGGRGPSLLFAALLNKRQDDELKVSIIELLIDKGAPINHVAKMSATMKKTVLMSAVELGNCLAVKKLLDKGADGSLKDADDHTVYDIANQINVSDCIRKALGLYPKRMSKMMSID